MKCTPIVLSSVNGSANLLQRIESKSSDEKSESWLQQLIFDNPELLPVTEFDESFAPLIPLGREINTGIGNIDVLYISPSGQLTIVETKLWKNPEKHRTVVAQIIDYAKELSRWSYDDLNNTVLKAARLEDANEKKNLDQRIEPYLVNNGMVLADFQERVIANLQSGEFLLLIAGDRISANLALLSEAIHGAPGLDFTIGLVELQMHPLNSDSDWPLLIIPDIVGRTVEKTRGVIKIQFEKERPKIEVLINEDEQILEEKGKTTQEIFLQKTPDDLRPVYEQWLETWKRQKNLQLYWGKVGFSLRPIVKGKPETVLDAYPEYLSLIKESMAQKSGASYE